jgi:hypothetical protein
MTQLTGFDWAGYFRGLPEDEAYALATWLARECLGVREFMEIVDRAYAAAPRPEREHREGFLVRRGRPAAEAYARCKRRFAGLVAAYELALMSGALRGEVTPEELDSCPWHGTERRRAEELLGALERAMCARE